jgi:hypothetical protein
MSSLGGAEPPCSAAPPMPGRRQAVKARRTSFLCSFNVDRFVIVWGRFLFPTVMVLEADDVVLAEIAAGPHLDDVQ